MYEKEISSLGFFFIHEILLRPLFFLIAELHIALVGRQAGYFRFSPFFRPQGFPVLQSIQPFPPPRMNQPCKPYFFSRENLFILRQKIVACPFGRKPIGSRPIFLHNPFLPVFQAVFSRLRESIVFINPLLKSRAIRPEVGIFFYQSPQVEESS